MRFEPRPGSVQASCTHMGGWRGGQQISKWMVGSGCLGPESGPPDKLRKVPPVHAGRSCLLLTWVHCHGNHWGAATWEGQRSGRAGGTLDMGRGVPQTLTPRCLLLDPWGPQGHFPTLPHGGSLLLQNVLVYVRCWW